MCPLTVDLQGDCDVHCAGHVDGGAHVFPGILRDGSLNMQTAITPLEGSSSLLHLQCEQKEKGACQTMINTHILHEGHA